MLNQLILEQSDALMLLARMLRLTITGPGKYALWP